MSATRRQLLWYAAIGTLAVSVDVLIFRALTGGGTVAEPAAVVGGLASMVLHFALNKWVNFRNHDRSLCDQLGTYCAVVSVWWVVTMTVVAVLTRGFMLAPVAAKLVAVAINFPLGFFAQRHLTFGRGIAAVLRRRRRGAS